MNLQVNMSSCQYLEITLNDGMCEYLLMLLLTNRSVTSLRN